MKTLFIIALLVAVSAIAESRRSKYNIDNARNLFDQFVRDYNKSYRDQADEDEHYDAFVNNLKLINDLNRDNNGETYGITENTDKTWEERRNDGYDGNDFLRIDKTWEERRNKGYVRNNYRRSDRTWDERRNEGYNGNDFYRRDSRTRSSWNYYKK